MLAGTRFLGPLTAVSDVLAAAGIAFTPGEDELRPARITAVLAEDLPLEYFEVELVRRTRGWDVALAHAIGELEAACLAPADLPTDTPQARDLARLWRRLDACSGTSFTRARIYREAAKLLACSPAAWPHRGPVLTAVTGHETAAQAAFLRAIPGAILAIQPARPRRDEQLARVSALYGAAARDALASAAPPPDGGTERDLLARYLFADVEALTEDMKQRQVASQK